MLDLEDAVRNGSGKGACYGILPVEKTNSHGKVVARVEEREIRNSSRIETSFKSTDQEASCDQSTAPFDPRLTDGYDTPAKLPIVRVDEEGL